jgi:hypothetical protein
MYENTVGVFATLDYCGEAVDGVRSYRSANKVAGSEGLLLCRSCNLLPLEDPYSVSRLDLNLMIHYLIDIQGVKSCWINGQAQATLIPSSFPEGFQSRSLPPPPLRQAAVPTQLAAHNPSLPTLDHGNAMQPCSCKEEWVRFEKKCGSANAY